MATRFQHYVPQVYLRAWENKVCSIKEPKKKFKGVYYYQKDDLSVGDGRNINSILAQNHTYTIDYEHTFVFDEMPEIANDYGAKIVEVLNKHKAIVYYNDRKLQTIEDLTSRDVFPFLEDWDFYKEDNPENLARKKSIINDIKGIHSYVIENKLDDFLEKEWVKIRNDFITAIEKEAQYTTMIDVRIEPALATRLIYSMLLLMCRNPVFDCLGIFPKIGNTFMKIFSMDELDEGERIKSKEVVNQQLHAAWLAEIYKGLFQSEKGFCKAYAENIQKKCQLIVLRCPERNGSFITSDNPAFMFLSNVTKENRNGFYFPLTPQYLLLIGKGMNDIGNIDIHTLSNLGVRFYNGIILSKATNSIVSTNRYLGYLI